MPDHENETDEERETRQAANIAAGREADEDGAAEEDEEQEA